jgi:hypothetical protein
MTDMDRERRALAVRGNTGRRFAHCIGEVKIPLDKSYCQSFCSSGLWVYSTLKTYNTLRVTYKMRVLLELPRFCSASGMFADAHVDGFQDLMKKNIIFTKHRMLGSSSILRVLAGRCDSVLLRHMITALINPNVGQMYYFN